MREINETNLPQLIVGLDSQSEDANYIHINDVKENVNYYCPCCKGLIKPRAYKKDEQYKMQPHFYHINGGCTEETYIHYICKNFLFETGSKFIVSGIEYEVKEVIIENGYNTKFGIYIPDITVITTSDKTFYFEIRNTNKKTTDYIPKWDELGNDVVEVDVKQFVNQKFDGCIPEFKLIYSNGECFVREYVHREYEEIEKRKLEWKRQDKLNYKIKWERLDWFWRELQEYKCMKCSKEDIIDAFKNLQFEDISFCWRIIHNHKLIEIDQECLDICNNEFDRQLSLNNISYRKYDSYTYYFSVGASKYIDSETISIKSRKKIKDIELFNRIVLELHIKERSLIQIYLVNLSEQFLNDIKKIEMSSDKYIVCLKSDYHCENGIYINYNNELNDLQFVNYYSDRKIKRFNRYKENKRQRIIEKEHRIKEQQIKNKRLKYEKEIVELRSRINNCKNRQWYCNCSWDDKINLNVELWFDRNPYGHTFLDYIYNCSLSFTIQEYSLRNFKDIIIEYMNKLYNMAGCKSFKAPSYSFKYHGLGNPKYRTLFIDSEVNNG